MTHSTCSRRSSDPEAGQVAGVVSLGVLAVAFGAMAMGVEWFWVAFPIGYGAVLPLAVGHAKSRTNAESEDEPDRLDDLRQRYVEGEIDEATFERRLDDLLDE